MWDDEREESAAMLKPRFTQDQIRAIVSELVAGRMAGEISRRHGISISTLYRWRAKVAGERQPDDKERLRSLEDEHRRLKRQFAELTLDYATLRAALIRDVRGDC
jgi:putative transposase